MNDRQPVGEAVRVAGGHPLYSPAMRFGGLVFCSGQAPVDPDTLAVRGSSFAEQAAVVLEKVSALLEEAGSGMDQAVAVDCFLRRAEDFAEWNDLFVAHFPPPRPARTTLVCDFAVPGILVEVRVVAALQPRASAP